MFHQNKPFLQIFFFWVLKNDFMNFFFTYFCRFRCSTVRHFPITITQTTLSSFLFSKSIQMDLCRRTRSLLARCLMAAVYCTNGNKDPIFRGQKCKDSNFCYKIRRMVIAKKGISGDRNFILKQCNNQGSGYATKVDRSS